MIPYTAESSTARAPIPFLPPLFSLLILLHHPDSAVSRKYQAFLPSGLHLVFTLLGVQLLRYL